MHTTRLMSKRGCKNKLNTYQSVTKREKKYLHGVAMNVPPEQSPLQCDLQTEIEPPWPPLTSFARTSR